MPNTFFPHSTFSQIPLTGFQCKSGFVSKQNGIKRIVDTRKTLANLKVERWIRVPIYQFHLYQKFIPVVSEKVRGSLTTIDFSRSDGDDAGQPLPQRLQVLRLTLCLSPYPSA